MGLVWNPYAVVGIVTTIVAFVASRFLFTHSAGRPANKRLALLILLEGVIWGFNQGPGWMHDSAGLMMLQGYVWVVVALALPFVYLWFMATLDSPLVAPLRHRAVVAGGVVLLVAVEVGAIVSMDRFILGVTTTWYAPVETVNGTPVVLASFGVPIVSLFNLVVVFDAYRRAPTGTPARRKMGYFLLRFGLRDAIYIALMAGIVFLYPAPPSGQWTDLVALYGPMLNLILFVLLITYGVLRAQLFDLDLRLRRGVSHGTVAIAFVAVYVLASEATRILVEPTLGPWLGLAAAAALVFALVPLHRVADRVATAVVPASSLDARKVEVYRSALEDAYSQGRGVLAAADVEFLTRLRGDLGLTERDHEVLAAAAGRVRVGTADDPLAALSGRFSVLRELGEGAFGRAFLARDKTLDRTVVLKLLRPSGGDPEAFLREARALARVRHPNVLAIHDAGRVGERPYLVVEHVAGGTLADRIGAGGRLAPGAFTLLAGGLLRALAAVHKAGLLHRDVKPSNLLLHGDEPRLADFGVAHVPGFEPTLGPAEVGTVRYMAPEQARGAPASVASDLYSAAATLFEAVSGRPYAAALPGEDAVGLRGRVRSGVPYPPEGCGRPALDAWLRRSLSPRAADRFDSAESMLAAMPADEALMG